MSDDGSSQSVIRLLSNDMRDRIAAGEVIERVASVVKELVENSMDASATMVDVDILQGGHEFIRVRDNGVGIAAHDLPLVTERHATSKIQSLEDLEAIYTWGFRGEALASIAAVSCVSVLSRHRDSEKGYSFDPSQPDELRPISHLPGTTIEVRQLFYNTPVRRKFLKTPKTEFSHIQDVMERFVLNNFECGFSLTHHSKTVFSVPPALDDQQKEERLSLVLGKDFVGQSMYIENRASDLSLSGWVSIPTFHRARPDRQFVYVNRRHVKDKMIAHAIRSAYSDVLFHGRHPVLALYLDIPADEVDVNVHPAKSEVRFFESRRVYEFISQSLKKAFASIAPQQLVDTPTAWSQSQPRQSSFSGQSSSATMTKTLEGLDQWHQAIRADDQEKKTLFNDVDNQGLRSSVSTVSSAGDQGHVSLVVSDGAPVLDAYAVPPLGFALAQLHQIYILSQTEGGLIIVDMHAAHERVLYEKLKSSYEVGSVVQQALLIPDVMDISAAEHCFAEAHSTLFERLGFSIELLSESELSISAVPALIQQNAVQVCRDLLSELSHDEVGEESIVNRLLGTCACRAAVHAQCRLSVSEMNALLRQMESTPHHYCCNHGRPAWVNVSMKELDQLFYRGQ